MVISVWQCAGFRCLNRSSGARRASHLALREIQALAVRDVTGASSCLRISSWLSKPQDLSLASESWLKLSSAGSSKACNLEWSHP